MLYAKFLRSSLSECNGFYHKATMNGTMIESTKGTHMTLESYNKQYRKCSLDILGNKYEMSQYPHVYIEET